MAAMNNYVPDSSLDHPPILYSRHGLEHERELLAIMARQLPPDLRCYVSEIAVDSKSTYTFVVQLRTADEEIANRIADCIEVTALTEIGGHNGIVVDGVVLPGCRGSGLSNVVTGERKRLRVGGDVPGHPEPVFDGGLTEPKKTPRLKRES